MIVILTTWAGTNASADQSLQMAKQEMLLPPHLESDNIILDKSLSH